MKRFISILALLIACAAPALCTDVIVSATTLSQLPFQPTNAGSDRTYTATLTSGSAGITVSPALPSTVIGRAGFQVVINGGLYPVAAIPNATTITLTIPWPGSSGAVSLTFPKFVILRIGVSAQFVTPEGDTVAPGNIQNGFFYKEVGVSIINTGGGNLAYLPTITLQATTNSTTNNTAKYSAGFFRADGSFIVSYSCFTSFSLPPTGITTWAAICTYNSSPVVIPNTGLVTNDALNARSRSCMSGQLYYFAADGNVLSCLTLGTNLSITSGILNATGGSGGGGSGGTLSNLNGLTGSTQTFATSNDANIALAVSSIGSTHTFTASWLGTLAQSRLPGTVVYNNQDNTFSGTQYFTGANLRLPVAAGFSAPLVAGSRNGFIGVDPNIGALKIGIGTNTYPIPYYGGSNANGKVVVTTTGGYQQFDTPLSYDAGSFTYYGADNLQLNKTFAILDQITMNGDPSRALSTHMQTMRAVTSQTGDFQRFTDSAGSSNLFRVRASGDVSIKGNNYNWPTTTPQGFLFNDGSLGLTWVPGAGQRVVTQTGHGFTASACTSTGGTCTVRPFYWSSSNTVTVAQNGAGSPNLATWANGLIIGITDANTLLVTSTGGYYTVTGHGLATDRVYFLADSGGLTDTAGTDARQPILEAIDANTILYYGRQQSGTAGSGGSFSGVSAVFGRSGAVTAQTGDYTFSQIGGTITNSMINSAAAISLSKLATVATSRVIVSDSSGVIGASAVLTTDLQNATSLQGRALASTAPTNGQAVVWSVSNNRWEPGTVSGGGGITDPGGNGWLVRTALNTTINRSFVAGTNIGITNPTGVGGDPTFSVTGPFTPTTLTQNGIVYGNNASGVLVSAASGAGTFCVIAVNGGPPGYLPCPGGGGGSSVWSSLTNPTAPLSLSMGTNLSTFTANTAITSTYTDVFKFSHTTSGTAAQGMGVAAAFSAQTTASARDLGRLAYEWQDATDSTRTARAAIELTYSGSAGVSNVRPYQFQVGGLELRPYDTTAGSSPAIRFFELAAGGVDYIGFKTTDTLAATVTYKYSGLDLPPTSGNWALAWGAGNLIQWAQFQPIVTATAPIIFSGNVASCPSCVTQSSNQVTLSAVLFAALGTPSSGTIAYCSDCTVANPCAGSGTGALAKRLNGAWVCN